MNEIKNLFDIVQSLLTSPNGDLSSKRFWASALFITGIVYIFTEKSANPTILASTFGTASLLLGIGAITKS